MTDKTIERTVALRQSSWELLDAATEFDADLTASLLLDSLVQRFLETDDGATIERAAALAELRKLFGKNQG